MPVKGQRQIWSIPNLISLVRLLLIPLMVHFYWKKKTVAALVVFGVLYEQSSLHPFMSLWVCKSASSSLLPSLVHNSNTATAYKQEDTLFTKPLMF